MQGDAVFAERCALPDFSPAMLHKAEVAAVAALAEGLGANEVDVMQVAVVDDVAAAKHGTEAIQNPFRICT
jgi:hypothetical protein